MFETYQGLASRYLDQSSQMEKLQQSFTDFKKKNDELKLIKNYMDLNKKCDQLQQDKNKLMQKVEGRKYELCSFREINNFSHRICQYFEISQSHVASFSYLK